MLMTPKWIPPDIISDEALDSYIQVSPKSHHVISVSAAMLTFPKKEKGVHYFLTKLVPISSILVNQSRSPMGPLPLQNSFHCINSSVYNLNFTANRPSSSLPPFPQESPF